MKKVVFLAGLIVILTSIPAFAVIAPFGLVQPNGGEAIPAEGSYPITWDPGPDVTLFNVYISYDNGMTWALLNKSGKVPGPTFDWSVPAVPKNRTKCRIKVIGYNSAGKVGADTSASAFSVEVLSITYPDAGAALDAGRIRTVTWAVPDLALVYDSAKLFYTLDGGLTWIPTGTFSTTPGPGSYDWTVPQAGKDISARLKLELWNGAAKAATAISAPFTLDASPKTNANASGSYHISIIEYDYWTLPVEWSSHVFDLTMNGAGLFNVDTIVSSKDPAPDPLVGIPYAISPDGQVLAENLRGIISTDDSLMVLADPNRSTKDLVIACAIKTTTGLTNADLSGTYIMGQVGNGWVGRFTATFDGAGNGNVHCDAMTGGCPFTDIPLTYSVDALTGQISDSLGHTGMLSSDGSVFTVTDYDNEVVPDGLLSIAVGIRKASGGLSNATGSGKFLAATFGQTASHGPWVDIFQLKLNGKGGGSATELYTSWPPLSAPTSVQYTIGADGSLDLGPAGGDVQGIVMENGQGFMVIDTATAGESSLTIGLKKAK